MGDNNGEKVDNYLFTLIFFVIYSYNYPMVVVDDEKFRYIELVKCRVPSNSFFCGMEVNKRLRWILVIPPFLFYRE
jgi:hypothetical protein